MLRSLLTPCLIALSITASSSVLLAQASYDSKGFETPAFTTGSIDGQGGWAVAVGEKDEATVQTEYVGDGNQAIMMQPTGERLLIRKRQKLTDDHFIDMLLRLPQGDAIKRNPAIHLRGRNSENKFDIYVSFSFNSAGSVSGVAGSKYAPGQWTRVTLHVRPSNDTWDLYLNGELAAENQPMRKNADVTSIEMIDIDWTGKTEATDPGVGVDNLQITAENPIGS